MHFDVAGITVAPWVPPAAGFVFAFFGSMVGISGGFLLMPFQMSVLGYVTPSVSATNLVFNLVAIPGGVGRFMREGRMLWPLAATIALGTLPGLAIGWWLRVKWITDPTGFKAFVGLVLAYLAWRLLRAVPGNGRPAGALRALRYSARRAEFKFDGQTHAYDPRGMLLLALLVGIIGGTYGIGGGAIIAPFCVTVFALPVHAVAGAALFATFVTSLAGVALYALLPAPPGVVAQPDWLLGLLFGAGGAAGMYVGARTQRHVPQRILRVGLALVLASIAAAYLLAFALSGES